MFARKRVTCIKSKRFAVLYVKERMASKREREIGKKYLGENV